MIFNALGTTAISVPPTTDVVTSRATPTTDVATIPETPTTDVATIPETITTDAATIPETPTTESDATTTATSLVAATPVATSSIPLAMSLQGDVSPGSPIPTTLGKI